MRICDLRWKCEARKLSLLDKLVYQTYPSCLARWRNAAAARAFDKWRFASRRRAASKTRRLRLLGAGSVCPVPLGADLSAFEHRLHNLEHLAKKLCVQRLEEQLGHAKAATHALTATDAAPFAARLKCGVPRHHESLRCTHRRPPKENTRPIGRPAEG